MTVKDNNLESLLEWINNTQDVHLKPSSHSYISPKIEVKDYGDNGGRGINSIQKINRSETILRIPPSFLLNTNTVIAHISKHNDSITLTEPYYLSLYTPYNNPSDKITKFYSLLSLPELLELTSFQLLSLYITLEKKRQSNSFWKPFINMLPDISDFTLTPLVWQVCKVPNYEQLLKLLTKSTKDHADKVYQRFINDYDIIKQLVISKLGEDEVDEYIPIESVLWSWLCINSRCLYMTLPQSKTTADNFTLAPYVDFLNHSCEDQCSIKADGLGFQVITTSSYDIDQQLFLSYGPHANDFLLCEYGFILPKDNKWNDVNISHYLLPLFSSAQIEFLKENDYYDNYTLTSTGISFRTEVALAILQEPNPAESRKLSALINGISDGSVYKSHSDALLTEILEKIIHKCKNQTYLEYADDLDLPTRARKRTIGILYRNILDICKYVKENL
ncbi:hypothetical protein DFJ63DRAFT_139510 [Scheffersomyces coipomensis]|uniref:uncharacterized protein n=1 Tax=Scheffersomyces coipomensis TaxID=1788519 RepID=UPI00315CF310